MSEKRVHGHHQNRYLKRSYYSGYGFHYSTGGEGDHEKKAQNPLDQFSIVPFLPGAEAATIALAGVMGTCFSILIRVLARLGREINNLLFELFFLIERIKRSFFSSLPFGVPKQYRILFGVIFQYLCVMLLYNHEEVFAWGYVFMDDLQRAVQQFLPAGGIGGGSAPLPSSPGPGGSNGIPNSFSWIDNNDFPGQEATSQSRASEAGPSGRRPLLLYTQFHYSV